MIQEYLFLSEKHKNDIQALTTPEGATTKIKTFRDNECWIYSLEISGNNERIAKLVSLFHSDFITKFSPIILTNDCAAYFSKRLYPLMNEFELKLRSFLYLASSCTKTPDDFKANIHGLEEKNLGDIFERLFIDETFVNDVKKSVNQDSHFDKKQLESTINGIPEAPLWDRSIPQNTVATLRRNYSEVREIRNKVMHAQDIDFKTFAKTKKLFKSINQELTYAINDIVEAAEEDRPNYVVFENFNSELGKVLMPAKQTIDNAVPGILNSELFEEENSVIKAARATTVALENYSARQDKIGSKIIETLKDLNIENFDPSKSEIHITLQKLGEHLSEGIQSSKGCQMKKEKQNQDNSEDVNNYDLNEGDDDK